jgi:anti-anti-sigma factor
VKIQTESTSGVVILSMSGRIETGGDKRLHRRFLEMFESGERRFVFDLRELAHIDSSLISESIACLKRARVNGGKLELVVAPGGKIQTLLECCNLHLVFDVHTDLDEAVKSVSVRP